MKSDTGVIHEERREIIDRVGPQFRHPFAHQGFGGGKGLPHREVVRLPSKVGDAIANGDDPQAQRHRDQTVARSGDPGDPFEFQPEDIQAQGDEIDHRWQRGDRAQRLRSFEIERKNPSRQPNEKQQ